MTETPLVHLRSGSLSYCVLHEKEAGDTTGKQINTTEPQISER